MSMDPNPRKRRRFPALTPAPDLGSDQPERLQRTYVEIKYKRHRAAKACNACRQAKVKCSEDRLECQRCQAKGQVCQYAIEDPGDQRKALQQELKSLHIENSNYKELIEYMRTASPLTLGERSIPFKAGRLWKKRWHSFGTIALPRYPLGQEARDIHS
ncbi:uncharacterized protein DFL_004579 [Arthrobotrys flagrans]|uniref:Zn(2)-C6 fungal-type domain-containing protein n=1 Tax=Arthrobotrys flagrans TaxID=97331 RepID=A0A437A5B5_ARTFL|nr:hypothetical protein DFL_004579 [Arthrobotrys flagrans]